MIVRYTELTRASASEPRPLLDVGVAGLEYVLIPCLVDSGAVNNLMPLWSAELAGVDLVGNDERRFGVGGSATTARFATVSRTAGDLTWEADVGFCEPWPYAWGLLGHESFFRWFTVSFRAADHEFEMDPIAE